MARLKNNISADKKTVQVNLSSMQNTLLKKLLAEPIDQAEEAALALCLAKDFLAGYQTSKTPKIGDVAIVAIDESENKAMWYYP